MSATVC